MGTMRRLCMVAGVVLVAVAAAGCAVEGGMQVHAPFDRSQHLCAAASPGSMDPAAVKKDLGVLLGDVPSAVVVKYLKPHDASVSRIGELTAGARNLYSYSHKDGQVLFIMLPTIQVTESRVMASNVMSFGFDELGDLPVEFDDRADYASHPYNVDIEGVMRLSFVERDLAQCVAEEFRLLQLPMSKQQQEQALVSFRAVAEQYRAMQVKPQVSEEQRRFIVQANALTQKRDFAKALALYEQALAVNPFSYPAAHYNMALISAQQGRYSTAIISMKKYLMLVPEAEDARAAQDKIYEWEALGGVQ